MAEKKTTKTTKAAPKSTTKKNLTNTNYDRWSDNGEAIKPVGKSQYGRK